MKIVSLAFSSKSKLQVTVLNIYSKVNRVIKNKESWLFYTENSKNKYYEENSKR